VQEGSIRQKTIGAKPGKRGWQGEKGLTPEVPFPLVKRILWSCCRLDKRKRRERQGVSWVTQGG